MYHEMINSATKNYPFFAEHINMKYIPHFHDETEIVFVLEGVLSVMLGDKSFTLKKDDICIITAGRIHNLYSYEYNKTVVMKLFPVLNLEGIELLEPVITPNNENYCLLKECILSIILENKTREIGYELSVNINAEKIFLMILRNMKCDRLENKSKTKLINQNELLTEVTAFLEKHYADDFLIDDVARYLNYTKSYFCHYFKRTSGVTFWKYYTIFRLEKSVQLIRKYPKRNLMEIALSSGFKNIRSFNQAFKEYHRCTPREYAKKYLN